jgi:hypothetical protein
LNTCPAEKCRSCFSASTGSGLATKALAANKLRAIVNLV